ncbi:hypothetical protein CEUSTIGMA_g6198.t1 [Chlamydomonas eustigma]|uniref:RING-type domain-containing protein n=1 Tax=Chlamydomonas eustigma TaxID=1157962 RepID=A0A250X6Q5_9CHLO|nr:hypothetical protein CEUSTIGMA_g6198.t1 [Chlamydomonas eustigma]|eukprot:GAX78761.1 hypothetical protein CEUSTIGMA_g6198.t1 [Chlamydomonas eustigma]
MRSAIILSECNEVAMIFKNEGPNCRVGLFPIVHYFLFLIFASDMDQLSTSAIVLGAIGGSLICVMLYFCIRISCLFCARPGSTTRSRHSFSQHRHLEGLHQQRRESRQRRRRRRRTAPEPLGGVAKEIIDTFPVRVYEPDFSSGHSGTSPMDLTTRSKMMQAVIDVLSTPPKQREVMSSAAGSTDTSIPMDPSTGLPILTQQRSSNLSTLLREHSSLGLPALPEHSVSDLPILPQIQTHVGGDLRSSGSTATWATQSGRFIMASSTAVMTSNNNSNPSTPISGSAHPRRSAAIPTVTGGSPSVRMADFARSLTHRATELVFRPVSSAYEPEEGDIEAPEEDYLECPDTPVADRSLAAAQEAGCAVGLLGGSIQQRMSCHFSNRLRQSGQKGSLDGNAASPGQGSGLAATTGQGSGLAAATATPLEDVPQAEDAECMRVPGGGSGAHSLQTVVLDSRPAPDQAAGKQEEDDSASTGSLEEEPTCPVCLCDFVSGDLLRILPCKHEFHCPCIDSWMEHHRTCPLCRLVLWEPPAEVVPAPPMPTITAPTPSAPMNNREAGGISAGRHRSTNTAGTVPPIRMGPPAPAAGGLGALLQPPGRGHRANPTQTSNAIGPPSQASNAAGHTSRLQRRS